MFNQESLWNIIFFLFFTSMGALSSGEETYFLVLFLILIVVIVIKVAYISPEKTDISKSNKIIFPEPKPVTPISNPDTVELSTKKQRKELLMLFTPDLCTSGADRFFS